MGANIAPLSPAKEAQLQQFIQSWRHLFGAHIPPAHELKSFCFRNGIGEDSRVQSAPLILAREATDGQHAVASPITLQALE